MDTPQSGRPRTQQGPSAKAAGREAAAAVREPAAGRVPAAGREPAAGTAGAALAGYLRAQAAALRALEAAVRRDEPDAVHRMRVAARRLRSALAACRPLLREGARTRALGERLRELGQVLGRARDAETSGARLTEQARALPPVAGPEQLAAAITRWSAERYRQVHREAVRFLDGDGYFTLLADVERFAARPPLRRRARGGRPVLEALLREEQRRTRRRLRAAFRVPEGARRDEALHGARKAAKRARYTAELAGADRLARRMRDLQEALGGYQDAVVAQRLLPELADRARLTGEGGFGYGVLYAVQQTRARADLSAARRAGREARRRRLSRLR